MMQTPTMLPGRAIRDRDGHVTGREPPEPAPELLTKEEAVRYLRLDGEDGPKDPYRTLDEYRQKGYLRAVPIGRTLKYPLDELRSFVRTLTDGNLREDPRRRRRR